VTNESALVGSGSFASKAAEAIRPCTSAAPPKADVNSTPWLRRFVPAANICTAAKQQSFDHLVGAAQQRDREREAECPGGLQVDDELHSYRLLDR
jgi:hypothetical protein